MSHYRKIDTRIWNDAKFSKLSDPAKLAFFMLLTHPSMTMLGAMRGTTAGLAEEISMPLEAFREAFGQVLRHGMAEQDSVAHLIALPNFLKYNHPESPNVVKSWTKALDLLPECPLKSRVVARSRAFVEGMSKAFGEALPEAFRKTYPNQEQEQEQEQEQDYSVAKATDAPGVAGPNMVSNMSPLEQAALMPPRAEGEKLTEDQEKLLWAGCRYLLAEQGVGNDTAGSFIGKLIKDVGGDRALVFDVMREACIEKPLGVRAWLTAACKQRKAQRGAPSATLNRQEALEKRLEAAGEEFKRMVRARSARQQPAANDNVIEAETRTIP